MGLQSGLLGLVSLIIIISITFYGINQVRHLQSDYQEKLKDIASQVNASQKYQARMDRKNQNNMENANHLMESIKGGYANKTELSKKIDTQQMQVGDMIKADKHATELNGNMLLTAAASRYTRNDNNNAEISNDLGVNKQLMIMGNSSGGTADRKIGIMNKLDVNGGLEVDLDSTSFEVTGRDLVSVGDSSAWMRKDGYVFGKNMIDSKDVMGETLKAGQTEFAKDGTLKASNNVRAFGQMAGSQITGRKTISVGNAEMSDLGNVKGRQLCMDGVCLLASDINYMKANSNPKDCLVGEWTDWGGCNKPCGNGMQFRWRNVLRPAEYDGLACPHLSEQKPCNLGTCLTSEPVYPAVDCVLSDWSAWDACSKTCGGGTQKRTKTILQPSENAGIPCPTLAELKQERPCNPDACPPPPVPRDCVLSDWSEYSACSAPCGGGKKTKTRTILQIAANGGLACPPESDLRFDADCNTDACVMSKLAVAVNTEWSVIQFKNLPSITTSGEWFVVFTTVNNAGNLVKVGMTTILKRVGSSTLSAGMGYTNLNQWNNQRAVFDASYVFKSVEFWSVNPATGALVDVPFNSFVLSVDNFDTGIDCMLNWSAWGSCSVTCGGGTRTRTATVIKNGSGIGSVCPTSLTQSDPCNTQPCNTTSFTYTINTEFSVIRFANLPSITTTAEWYIAFSNINGGTLTRVGTTTVTKRLNGSYALSAGMGFTNLNQWNNQTVYFDASYVFNTVEFWSYSATSGVVSIPLNSFQLSSANFTTGIDCVLQWPDWSACSVSSGGTQTRTAIIIKNGSGIGVVCPSTTQTQPCSLNLTTSYDMKINLNVDMGGIQWFKLPTTDNSGVNITWKAGTANSNFSNIRIFTDGVLCFSYRSTIKNDSLPLIAIATGYSNLSVTLNITISSTAQTVALIHTGNNISRWLDPPATGCALGRFYFSEPLNVKYFYVYGFPYSFPTSPNGLNPNTQMGSSQYPYLNLYDSANNIIASANPCEDYTGLPSTYASFFNRVFVVNTSKTIGTIEKNAPSAAAIGVKSVQFVWVSTYSWPLDWSYNWSPSLNIGDIDCYPYG